MSKNSVSDDKYQTLVEELRTTQLLLKASLESPKDIIILSIDRNYLYLFFNNAHKASMKLAYNIDVKIGMSILDCVAEKNDRKKLKVHYDQALAGEAHSTIEEYGDSVRFFFETFFNPLRDDSGNVIGVSVFARDITESKKTKEELQKNNTRHAAMIANIGEVICIIAADGTMKYSSPNVTKLFGWDQNEFIGLDVWQTVHPNDVKRLQAEFTDLLKVENKSVTVEYKGKRKDGSYTWIELTAVNRLHDPAIEGVLLNYHDIMERKLSEELLMTSELNYRSLFTNMITGCAQHKIVTDENGKPIDYIFLEANAAFEKMTGLKSTDIIGKKVTEVLPGIENDPGDWIGKYGKVALTGTPLSFEQHSESLNKWYSVFAYAPIDGQFVTLFFDISENKLSRETIAAEKERLAVTLRSIGDGVITTDTNGIIQILNRAAEQLTGWNSSDAVGKPFSEVLHIINEITKEQCENPVEKVLATGNVVEMANHTCLIAKNGRQINIADSGAPIRDNDNRIIGVVLVFRDMTEKHKLNASMQRAQKLESLGILAGGIAHDFNNLLGGIFGYLDMANSHFVNEKDNKVSQYLTKATSVLDRARALTQQLLTFSKGGAPIRKQMVLGPFIKKTAEFALSGSNVACQIDIADNLWVCNCDENQIGQVIENIVINAKQAMTMGGKIIITGQNVLNKENLPDEISEKNNFVKISIKDSGIGMPREILSKIFDPFFSTKETGHGLGLATVFSIIQRHGGWIDIESEPGKGSTFHIFIPASKISVSHSSDANHTLHKGSGSILIMDDEDFMLEIVGVILNKMGYSVVKTHNGQEAVHIFSQALQSGKPFTACILDLTIPGEMGGKEVAKEIRNINNKAILFASSGYSEDPVISNPTEHGFTASIIKPFKQADLSHMLELHLKALK